MKRPFLILSLLGAVAASPGGEMVIESARDIPVAYEVDVVVAGGTTGAVTAAVEAAQAGAKVFLAAPRPYLGEDVAGNLRLWLEPDEKPESALERAVFERSGATAGFPNRIDFTYTADQPSDRKHADPQNRILNDGKWASAASQSVQYNADTTIVADLGKTMRVRELHLMSFARPGDFEAGEVEIWTSLNGQLWRTLSQAAVKNEGGGGEDPAVQWSIEVKQPCRYVKALVRKKEDAQRLLLGELILVEEGEAKIDETATTFPATPMQAKSALDEALLNAGVQFLYGSMVSDLIVDEKGAAAGVVMVNRAGRQAVLAKTVIDATTRATVARAAGVSFEPFPAGRQVFQRIVAGGAPRSGEGIQVRTAPVKFYSEEGPHDVFVYELTLPMPDNSAASFARAEVLARGLTFDVALADESDQLFQVPPDPMRARASADRFEAASLDLNVLRPAELDRFFVLGGCAGLSRPAAGELLRPLNLMRLGQRVGKAAAAEAAEAMIAGKVGVKAPSPEHAKAAGEVREFLNGSRPTHRGLPTIPSPQRSLPVLGSFDVVVAGGGTGGAPAGIGAGRHGASSLIIEYQDHLGGVGTLGLISSYYHGYRHGFTSEIDGKVKAMGGPDRKGGWNPVAKREVWRTEALQAGAEIWFSSMAAGSVVKDGKVVGVVVATPQGRGVVLAKAVVDSTGNSDVAVAAGADFTTTSAEHVAMQGTGLSPRKLGAGYTNTDYSFADESDPVDQWRMIVAARKKFKNSYDLSPFIDTRERRRIVGDVSISPLDILNKRTWHDTFSLHDSNFDTHGFTVHPVFLINFPDKKGMIAEVPYRAMLPKNLDGIMVTGLGMSAHRDAMPILRMQACIQNQGYAAGWASAEIAAQGIPTRSLDVKSVQRHLVEIGSLPASVLEAQESAPLSEETIAKAAETVVHDYQGLAILLEEKERALPHLRKAFQQAATDEDRLVYANILGMMGDASGSKTLAAVIAGQEWDDGWNFRGMGQFGGSISRLDSHIIALGRSGDAAVALPAILAKAKQLDATREFSHHRAVAMALESLKDPSAAPVLAEVLEKEKMTGHVIAEIGQSHRQEERTEPLREIILARALYRCGDHKGLGEKILRQYREDLRALFAQHADAVLNEKR